jgi:hypothetical protein
MCNIGRFRTIHKGFRGVLPQAALRALLCASLTTFAGTAFEQQGTFVPTGSMITKRACHTATLLNNGKVLIAGGDDGTSNNGLAIAVLYDPATGTFTTVGRFTTGSLPNHAGQGIVYPANL